MACMVTNGMRDISKEESGSHCGNSSGVMENVDLVLRRLRRDLERGGRGRGGEWDSITAWQQQ